MSFETGNGQEPPHGDLAIDVRNVSKAFRIFGSPQDRLKQSLWRGRRQYFEEFWALRDITFSVRRGHTVGIIGRNGSGKSTLLQIIASTLAPTTGSVTVKGRIAALLELGAGFNPEFTGLENIRLNASILGLSEAEIDRLMDPIAAFADIGDFIEQPVKKYSTGMYARLGFAIGIHVAPDVFVIDEALSVGDVFFQSRCFRKLGEYRESGGTVLFVSHDTSAVSRICDQAVVLHRGGLVFDGAGNEAINAYYRFESGTDQPAKVDEPRVEADAAPSGIDGIAPVELRRDMATGDGSVSIEAVRLIDADGRPSMAFDVGSEMQVVADLRILRDLDAFDFGVGIRDRTASLIGGAHSHHQADQTPFGPVRAGDVIRLSATVALDIEPGKYLLIVGVSRNHSHETWEEYCVLWDCCAIDVIGVADFWGMTRLRASLRQLEAPSTIARAGA